MFCFKSSEDVLVVRADLILNTGRHCRQIKQESKNLETYRMSKSGETCLNAGRTPGMYSCVQYTYTSASQRIKKLGKKLVKLIKLKQDKASDNEDEEFSWVQGD
jgi:hypothetical protein